MIKHYTIDHYSREIEYGWNFSKGLVETILFHPDVRVIDARKIEQQQLENHNTLVTKDFDGKAFKEATICQVRIRIRKTTFLEVTSSEAKFSTNEPMYEYTTKYCLPNEDSRLPDDRMELNAPITKREYDWLSENGVEQGGFSEPVSKLRYTLENNGWNFCLDIPSKGDTARLELELLHRKDAKGSKSQYLPSWLAKLLEDDEQENQGKSK